MKRHGLIVALLLSTPLLGCNNDPGEGKEQAQVAEPVAESHEAHANHEAAAAQGQPYEFNQNGSELNFVGAKVTGKHNGAFKQFAGTIDLVDGDPTKSSVKVDIEMASVEADAAKLTAHLKSPDFFQAEAHPKATFHSTTIAKHDDAYHVTGNLTLRGTTKSITFPASIEVHEGAVDVKADFAINRKDFGIVYPGMPDDLIKDNVALTLNIHAVPAGHS